MRRCLHCERLIAPGARCECRRGAYRAPEYRKLLPPVGLPCALQGDRCTHWATTWDHIVPISRGGTNSHDNLQPACRPCNSSKKGNG